jgi:hypothetical protein
VAFESIFRKASAALAVSTYALCVGAAPVVQAQVLAMGESTTIGSEALPGAIPERIILHGLRFQANSDKIDKSSVPVLKPKCQTAATEGSVNVVRAAEVRSRSLATFCRLID